MHDMKAIAKAIDAVKTVGGARVLIGQTLKDVSAGYATIAKIGDKGVRDTAKRDLDSARTALESYYKYIAQMPDKTAISQSFRAKGKPLVLKAYMAMAGSAGAAAYVPPSGAQVLKDLLIDEAANRGHDIARAGKAAADAVAEAGRIPWQFIALAGGALYYLGSRRR